MESLNIPDPDHEDLQKALILYSEFMGKKEGSSDLSTYVRERECFPWLCDEEGHIEDYNKRVTLFDGLKSVYKFIKIKYGVDGNNLPQSKISDYIAPFNDNEEGIRLIDLYNKITAVYNKDRDKFIKDFKNELSIPKDDELSISQNISRPLGDFTFMGNELANKLKDLKWEVIYGKAELSVNVLPLAAHTIGLGLILRSYVKYVHNRPFITKDQISLARKRNIRNRHLFLFSVLGAPLILYILRRTGTLAGDVFSLKFDLSKPLDKGLVEPSDVNRSNNTSLFGIFTFLGNRASGHNNTSCLARIKKWLKLIFIIIFLLGLIVRIYGLSSFVNFITNAYYIKIYFIVGCMLAIIFLLFELYAVHLFVSNKLKIPELLPEFMIKFFSDMKFISSSPQLLKDFKRNTYKEVTLYLILLFIACIL